MTPEQHARAEAANRAAERTHNERAERRRIASGQSWRVPAYHQEWRLALAVVGACVAVALVAAWWRI